MPDKKIPYMAFGKYKGVRVDQLPMSYCRWMLSHKFPEEIMVHVREKLSHNQSSKVLIECTRHAIDSFSLRHIKLWQVSNPQMGIASFIAELALEAYEQGTDVSKSRHSDEELRKEWQGIVFVFNREGEQKVLITVM